MEHTLKIEDQFLDRLLDGTKTFEVRYNDRGYQKGDTICFRRLARDHRFLITYVLSGWGITDGHVALGLQRLTTSTADPEPSPRSVVLDATGTVWQRTFSSNTCHWVSPDHVGSRGWQYVCSSGPVTVLHHAGGA